MFLYQNLLIITRNESCAAAVEYFKTNGFSLDNTSIWQAKSDSDMLIAYFRSNVVSGQNNKDIVTQTVSTFDFSRLPQLIYTLRMYSQPKNLKISDFVNVNGSYYDRDNLFKILSEFVKKKITEETTFWVTSTILKDCSDYLAKTGLIPSKHDNKGKISPENNFSQFSQTTPGFSSTSNMGFPNITPSFSATPSAAFATPGFLATPNSFTQSTPNFQVSFTDNRDPRTHLIAEIQVFLGDWRSAKDDSLCNSNIKLVVNCAVNERIPNYFENRGIKYVTININKNSVEGDPTKDWENVFRVMKQAIDSDQGILIHGVRGENLSACTAIVFVTLLLGQKYNVTFEDVYMKIREQRPCVNVDMKYLKLGSAYLTSKGFDNLSSREKLG